MADIVPPTEEPKVDNPPTEEPKQEPEVDIPPTEEPKEEPKPKVNEAPKDMVAEALRQNEELKKQLESLNSNADVLQQNELLKKELENQQKLVQIAKENAELQQQLEAMKRQALIDSLITQGSINNDLRGWAAQMDYQSLQEFAKHAPKVKTILDQKNTGTLEDADMKKWKEEQQKSRINQPPQPK